MEAVSIHSPGALVPLLPRFLMKRRRGNAGLATILAESGLSRPGIFMLVRLAQGIEEGETAEELRPGAPGAGDLRPLDGARRRPHRRLARGLLPGSRARRADAALAGRRRDARGV